MTRKLPATASVATPLDGGKLHAPAAERNVAHLTQLLLDHAPAQGSALEIASGTGQHVTAFARALPGLLWHPSDVEAARLASIDAHAAEAALDNLAPAMNLDATRRGWGAAQPPHNLIVLVNLLHLLRESEAAVVLREAADALAAEGVLVLYGPFRRSGLLTSQGDALFDAQLRAADPQIGYKDDRQIADWLRGLRLSITRIEMPANNLAFVARKP